LVRVPVPVECPCGQRDERGRAQAFAACCGRYLGGQALAPDAQQLMRSRYTAYTLGLAPYLLSTWHPSTRPAELSLDANVKWLGLEVRHHNALDTERAEVEFVARSRVGGRGQRLHERSRFVREGGQWLYVDGDLL
jgi:SEC-C motif-containing protein